MPEKSGRQCQGRDREGQTERLDKIVPFKTQRLDVWHRGNDKDASAARNESSGQPDDGGGPSFPSRGNPEGARKQGVGRIHNEREAERSRASVRIAAGKKGGPGKRSDDDRRHHGPESNDECAEARPGQELPDIGHKRGHQQKCGCGQRRDERTKHAHGNSGQAHSGNALYRASGKKGQYDDDDSGSILFHAARINCLRPSRNAEVPQPAFGLAKG